MIDTTGLEPDAIRVLELIADRLRRGRQQYGDLDIANDQRNMIGETVEEFLDSSVYLAIELLKRR